LDLLVDAAGDLVRRGERVEVLIAGAGRAESALRRRAEGLPVRFLGLCRDVPAFLRTLDVFCLPSRREALSLALLEAVGHGLPCVTTAVGDVVEALDRAALIVAPDDRTALVNALRKLVHDPALRGHLGSRARARALREFDVRMMANRTLAVLAQATRRPAPTPG
jgi:glycosyltransferase involved in cell wall biosynthesis